MEKAECAKNQKKFDRYSWKAYNYGVKCKQFMMNEYAMDIRATSVGHWSVSNQNEMFAVPIANTKVMNIKLHQFIENIAISIRSDPQSDVIAGRTRAKVRTTCSGGCVNTAKEAVKWFLTHANGRQGCVAEEHVDDMSALMDLGHLASRFLSGLAQILSPESTSTTPIGEQDVFFRYITGEHHAQYLGADANNRSRWCVVNIFVKWIQ